MVTTGRDRYQLCPNPDNNFTFGRICNFRRSNMEERKLRFIRSYLNKKEYVFDKPTILYISKNLILSTWLSSTNFTITKCTFVCWTVLRFVTTATTDGSIKFVPIEWFFPENKAFSCLITVEVQDLHTPSVILHWNC